MNVIYTVKEFYPQQGASRNGSVWLKVIYVKIKLQDITAVKAGYYNYSDDHNPTKSSHTQLDCGLEEQDYIYDFNGLERLESCISAYP